MKANELMIGDWVLTLESTHKKEIFAQIWAIEEGQTSILVKKDISNWFVDIEWIEPIPLTPEILEKNGFELEKGQNSRCYHAQMERMIITLYRSHTFYSIMINTDLHFPVLNNIQLLSVHELQHALRLCGIEKEIVLR